MASTYDGDAYDGNPPYTPEEQQSRFEYIKGVFDREYSAERYQPIQGRYLAYLYTSHYIENINFDRTKTLQQNFSPVWANIIGSADIEAFNSFYNIQQNSGIMESFLSIGSLFSSIESSGISKTLIGGAIKNLKDLLNDDLSALLNEFEACGIVDTTTISEITQQMKQVYLENYDTATSSEQLITLIHQQLSSQGVTTMMARHYVATMQTAIESSLATTVVCPVIGSVFIIFNQLNSVINTSSLGGLYYSYNTRKQLRLAIYYGISQRP